MGKLCFVLGAGGARGIAHVGFLQAMEENGIIPDCIAGCSMGSVVGACYALGMKPVEMMKFVEELKFADIVDVSTFPFTKKGVLQSVKVRRKLEAVIGDADFKDLKIPFECIAADIVSGRLITLKDGKVAEAVMASSAIPAVFHPVERDGMVLVDGALYMALPLNCVSDFGADKVVVVDVLGKLRPYKNNKNIVNHVMRMIDANTYFLTKRHLESFRHDVLIRPDLGDMSQFRVEKLQYAYEQGYKAGLENLESIKKLIAE